MRRKSVNLFVVTLITTMLVGCSNAENTSTNSENSSLKNESTENVSTDEIIATESIETSSITSTEESTKTSVEEFDFRIIDYLTDAEVVETVFSVSEEGRPCVNVTHADGTTQYHELYEEQGEILWSAVVQGENEGIWGGDYRIATQEPAELPSTTVEPTEPSTQEVVHKHSYKETIIKEAFCHEAGVKSYSCSCGDSYEEEYSDSWNHQGDGNSVIVMAPTCTEEGLASEHCKHCKAQLNYRVNIPALGHVPEDFWIYHHGTGTYRLGCANCGVLLEERNDEPEGVEIQDFYPRDGLEIIDPFPR